MTTGEKIATERKKLNLTQQEFADRLGVTRQAASRWESDLAFPETDKLVKMSELFGCSIDYLLKYNDGGTASGGRAANDNAGNNGSSETDNGAANGGGNDSGERNTSGGMRVFIFDPTKFHFEFKSKTTVFGLPLLHVNIGLGKVAKGFFSFGLVSLGVVSAGLVSLGVFAFGLIALGMLAFGAFSVGAVSAGAVSVGIIAIGGVAVGGFAFGGCSVGLFACGGYANGYYVAIGDYAVGQIAFGKSTAIGSKISVTQENYVELKEQAFALMDELPAFWKGLTNCCKGLAQGAMKNWK